jgi:NAD(P)-dependent dehydrogenase (short-subunit alcohol dehydrogenase family)
MVYRDREGAMPDVTVVIGSGGIGTAIARRLGNGRTVLLADNNSGLLERAAAELRDAGYTIETQVADVSDRASVRALAASAAGLGPVLQVINTAGLSPNMAPVERLLAVDLYGAAVVFEEFEAVIAPGGAGLIIASMAGHMMPALSPEQDQALARTPRMTCWRLPSCKARPCPTRWWPT